MRLPVRSPMSTARTIVFLLQAILVSVGVKSACVEEDCTEQAITVIDPSSGECVSCFPCPQCEEGQTPSVPCASTVPQGTDIHCVPIEPSPSLVSTLVLSWHASITGTSRQITATTHTHEHLSVSATSSKDYAGSSSSITVDTESNDEENTGSTIIPENYSKMGNRTAVYLFCGVSLLVIFLGILFRLRKSKTARSHLRIGDQTIPISPCSSMTGATPVDNSVHGTVHLEPNTNRALFVRSHTNNGDQQDTPEGNENHTFQPQRDQTFHGENGIPSSLDDNNAQGNENSKELYLSTVVTEDHSPLNDLTGNEPASDFREFENCLLTRKMGTIPFQQFYCNICTKLDVERPWGDDYRTFGERIGLSRDEILLLAQKQEPTHFMLQKFDSQKNSSIGKFKNIMEDMDRHDVVSIIDEWISYEQGLRM